MNYLFTKSRLLFKALRHRRCPEWKRVLLFNIINNLSPTRARFTIILTDVQSNYRRSLYSYPIITSYYLRWPVNYIIDPRMISGRYNGHSTISLSTSRFKVDRVFWTEAQVTRWQPFIIIGWLNRITGDPLFAFLYLVHVRERSDIRACLLVMIVRQGLPRR